MFHQYPIIALIGDKGGGKTLTMTALGKMFQSQGMTIFANYTLHDTEYEHIEFSDIVEFPEFLHDGVILIDEAHIGTDAYAFFTKRVKEITKFATQTRKRKLIFIYTTQIFTQTAKRLRALTNYIVYCNPADYPDLFELRIHNREGDNDGYIKTLYLDGEPFYPFYDTNEIIELKENLKKPLTY